MNSDPTRQPDPVAAPAQAWRLAFPLVVTLLAAVLLLYWDTGAAIVHIWLRSETFTHGFIVPPIVLWLVWRRRPDLAQRTPRPSAWGLLLLAGAGLAWLLGDLVAVNALTQLALVGMLVALVPALLGWSVSLAIAFPLAFLFFAVPFGEFFMPQLMIWTADFTVQALRLSGIPVYREGLQFVIPSGNWSVVEACSGIRYLIASLTVGTLFAYLNYRSFKRRAIFVAVSIIVPVVANWLRAYMIVMLGHLSGNKLATGVDHLIYGWFFFGIVIFLMFMIGARWSEPDAPAVTPLSGAQALAARAPAPRPALLLAIAMLAALLVGTPQAARWAIARADSAAPVQLVAPASLADGWVASPEPAADWTPAFQNPSAQFNTSYRRGASTVGLYVGYYRQQNYERKLVSSENMLVTTKDKQWARLGGGSTAVTLNGQEVGLRTAELRSVLQAGRSQEDGLTVWQVYWIDGTLTASDWRAKLYSALHRLAGRGDDSAVIILYAPRGNAGEGDKALEAFLQANAASLESLLQRTRAQR